MVTPAAAGGGGLLLRRLLALGIIWACIGCVALSSPLRAGATAYSEPKEPFTNPSFGAAFPQCHQLTIPGAKEGEANYTTNQYLERIANEAFGHCETEHTDFERLGKRLFWVTEEVLILREKVELLHKDLGAEGQLHSDLVQLHTDLTIKGGLSVAVASLPELTAGTKAIGTVEVSKAPPDTYVQSAVLQNSETINQDLWALAGLLAGAALLVWAFKMVRP